MWPNRQETVDLVTFTEEILNGKLHFLCSACCDLLNRHAPRRKQYLRANHKPFINVKISRGIMIRTKLRNCYLKSRSEENRETNMFHFYKIRRKNNSPI